MSDQNIKPQPRRRGKSGKSGNLPQEAAGLRPLPEGWVYEDGNKDIRHYDASGQQNGRPIPIDETDNWFAEAESN